jgi:hypothetical protein
LVWYQPGAAATDVFQIKFMRDAKYSGGSTAWNCATYVETTAAQNTQSSEWNSVNALFNSSKGNLTPSSENTAGYDQAIKASGVSGGVSHMAARVIEHIDNELNPAFTSGSLEIDQRVVGNNNTDNNNNRYCIYMVFSPSVLTGVSGTEIASGISTLVWYGTNVKNLFYQSSGQAGTIGNYFNFPKFLVTSKGDITGHNLIINRDSAMPVTGGEIDLRIDGSTWFKQYVDTSGRVNFDGNLNAKVQLDHTSASFKPQSNGVLNLGTSSNRWNTVYAATGAINTSDLNLKTPLQQWSDQVLDAVGEVQTGIYQWLDAVEQKGEQNARFHAGAIAQQIEESFLKYGLDVQRYAFWCNDAIVEDIEEEVWIDNAPVMEQYMSTEEEIVIEDGRAIRRFVKKDFQRQALDLIPLFDENGEPVMASTRAHLNQTSAADTASNASVMPTQQMTGIPRTERRLVKQKVSRPVYGPDQQPLYRKGLRYDQLLILMQAWSRRELQRLSVRISRLEATS